MEYDREFYRELHKAELHMHLDGSPRIQSVIDIATRNGVELPTTDTTTLQNLLSPPMDEPSLEKYLRAFSITGSVMQTTDALTQISTEVVEDAYNSGVRHIEIRYDPLLFCENGLTLDETIRTISEATHNASEQFDVSVGIIICSLKHLSSNRAVEIATAAVKARQSGLNVVGFDLAGPETCTAAIDFQKAIDIAHKGGLAVTIHAGEAQGPPAILDATCFGLAMRIGHGTRAKEDPDVLQYLIETRTPLEICPTSNLQTGIVQSLNQHPTIEYLRAGACVVVCTDNVLMSNINLADEYRSVMVEMGASPEELLIIADNGFLAAFLPAEQRMILRRNALTHNLCLLERYGADMKNVVTKLMKFPQMAPLKDVMRAFYLPTIISEPIQSTKHTTNIEMGEFVTLSSLLNCESPLDETLSIIRQSWKTTLVVDAELEDETHGVIPSFFCRIILPQGAILGKSTMGHMSVKNPIIVIQSQDHPQSDVMMELGLQLCIVEDDSLIGDIMRAVVATHRDDRSQLIFEAISNL